MFCRCAFLTIRLLYPSPRAAAVITVSKFRSNSQVRLVKFTQTFRASRVWKVRKLSSIFGTVAIDAIKFWNEASCRKSKTVSESDSDCVLSVASRAQDPPPWLWLRPAYCFASVTENNKKLISRWDSERELSLRRHCARTTKYNRLMHKFRHRSMRWCVEHRFTNRFWCQSKAHIRLPISD